METKTQGTLREWLADHEFELQPPDTEFLAESMDEIGWFAGLSQQERTPDWSLFIAKDADFVVENTVQGTSVCDVDLFGLTSYPGHAEVRDLTARGDGLSPQELCDAIRDMGDCTQVILRIADE